MSRSWTPRAAPIRPASAKNAIARVWVKPGAGKITVNGKDVAAYFARPVLQMMVGPAAERPPTAPPSMTSSAPSKVRACRARPAPSATACRTP